MHDSVQPAVPAHSLEKEWWLRALMVLQSPRAVFAALRDDSAGAAAARQEPMAAVVFLAGIASVLATGTAGRLMDDPVYDSLLVVLWAIVAGGIYGVASYWIAGGALYIGARGTGGGGSYRRARHLLGLSAAPLVLSLLALWPVRLALFGSDVFRSGGSDAGSGGRLFEGLEAVFLLWTLALLLIGVRTVHGWSWSRSLAAVALALLTLVAFGVTAALL